MKYKITYIAAVSISLSLSGTSENQTFDDKRHNDLINVKETKQPFMKYRQYRSIMKLA
jgi:hypothetical protein